MANAYREREYEFAQAYEDFEAEDVVKLVVATGEWLETLLLDADVVDQTMKTLLAGVAGQESAERGGSWRDLWNDLEGHESDLRSAQFMVSLNAFAFYGLRPDGDFLDAMDGNPPPSDDAVKAFVLAGRKLVDAVPSGWATVSELARTVHAAEARLRLDIGADLTVEQLAAIARVNAKSVRNMLTPKGGTPDLALNAAGEIPSADALRWLSRRMDFKSSIWRDEIAPQPVGAVDEEGELDDVVFVPVAKDGSRFDSDTCLRNGGYTIGPKGDEVRIDDYREALRRLSRMRTPRWRRQNDEGNWGIVAGTSWQRAIASEIGKNAVSA